MELPIFTFFISEHEARCKRNELKERIKFGKYFVYTDVNTLYDFKSEGNNGCAVFGMAVNVITGESDNIADKIIDNCLNIEEVIEYEKQLGGKYIIIFRKDNKYYLLGDATCSIPVYYSTTKSFICSSNCQYIVNENNYKQDHECSYIRRSGDISQAMPFDITSYREIKQMLPNHYLEFANRKSIRFVNANTQQEIVSADDAAEVTAPMIANMCEFYQKKYSIKCPITSGRDSRVVLAFLRSKDSVPCYTIRHANHSGSEEDLVIPPDICKLCHTPYEQIVDCEVPLELSNHIDDLLGKDQYSHRTLQIAYTIKKHYGSSAVINGDIIGQVGKCSLHRDIPAVFATPKYFRCKLHNYSKQSVRYIKDWIDEIRNSEEKVNLFDLFSIENRMGRWASQENLIYNSIGQAYLNVFNSRRIIYAWTAVSRKERKKSLIHNALINRVNNKLLEVPFHSDSKISIKISKATGMNYLIASYAKYYMECIRFRRRQINEKNNSYS